MALLPPAPGFDDPIALLAACHDRILSHCQLLDRIAAHRDAGDTSPSVMEACTQAIRYFSTAGQHHHDDEEHDLFPRLLKRDSSLGETLAQLGRDHERLQRMWQTLERMLENLANTTAAEFSAQVREFCLAQRAHVDLENTVLLPTARARLSPADEKEIGLAMARRRGITVPATVPPITNPS